MSGEQPSPLGDSDYREIAEEIAEEMKEPDERLLSSEQPSPLGDSDYREIAEEIAEEREKEVEAGQEHTAVVTKEPENMGDSDYREIAEEIAEEMKEPDERLLSGEQPSPPGDSDYEVIAAEIENARHMSPSDLWDSLSRYLIAWFAIGVVVVLIITFLFFEPLYCVLEFRLNETKVALIGLLALGAAGMTFIIAPPQTDKVLRSLYVGIAVASIIVVIVMQFLPQPSRDHCFPTQVPTPIPTPVYVTTPTSIGTPANTSSPTPTPTLAARATRVWESIAILSPSEGK